MDISNTAKLAIKSVVYIASRRAISDYVNIKEIIENVDENEHSVRKTLQTLVKQGVLNSFQGAKGGFTISEKQLQLPILKIVEITDGVHRLNTCILGLSQCSESHPCPLHMEYKSAKESIYKLLKTNTIADLSQLTVGGLAFLRN